MKYYKKLAQYYTRLAIMVMNIFVVLLVVNVGLYFANLFANRYLGTSDLDKLGMENLKQVYPDLSTNEIEILFQETWWPNQSSRLTYEPFTQFKERARTGKYVNVDPNGFRLSKNQGPWPPDPNNFNIFLLGGSTTFGYGLVDEETLASYLQDHLSQSELGQEVKVYNFGRAAYYSSQELRLYERLLTAGFVPDMAIFVDGLNEFWLVDDSPAHTAQLELIFDEGNNTNKALGIVIRNLPMFKAANFIKDRVSPAKASSSISTDLSENDLAISKVANRYLENKKIIEAISTTYGVTPVFVWQPIPVYKYDLQYHLFAKVGFGRWINGQYGYPAMAKLTSEGSLGDNFIWLADIQTDKKIPLYVDQIHYSAVMANLLAGAIQEQLLERNLLTASNSSTS